ncbi:MAG: AI-2E family transporter [Bacilli bacterium]|nr:AI-2E family transporter [Bacilli bacterium]MDY5996265.1 AI-2E family transporter [Bacilli bacterium]MEE1371551.1 AI-2E family transporter [Bacilli bacterium]
MKRDIKKNIILIITYIALIIFVLVNFEKILSILGYIINIFSPFIFGAIVAFVLNVLVNFIERKLFGKVKKKTWLKIKRPLSIAISVVLVIFIIVFIMNLLIPQLKNSVSLFTDSLPTYKEDIINIMNKFNLEETTIKKVSDYLDNFGKVITDYIKGNSKDVITVTTEVATSLIAIISKAVIAIVFAIYIIAQKETLKRQFNKLMSAYLKPRTVNRINKYASMANTTFSNFVTGQCLEALIFGSLCFLGMLILRLPYATTIAVLLGFTALIPVFGAFIGTFLGAFLILMISPIKAIIFVVFILVLQQIEGNLIYPKVVGKSVGLPGIWVLLSVTIGASVGGILGMLIATPLCSLLYILLRQAVNDRINSNKIVNRVKEKV